MLREEKTWNHIKCSIKIRESRKSGEDLFWSTNDKEQQIENNYKYGSHWSNYVIIHFKCELSKHTN